MAAVAAGLRRAPAVPTVDRKRLGLRVTQEKLLYATDSRHVSQSHVTTRYLHTCMHASVFSRARESGFPSRKPIYTPVWRAQKPEGKH